MTDTMAEINTKPMADFAKFLFDAAARDFVDWARHTGFADASIRQFSVQLSADVFTKLIELTDPPDVAAAALRLAWLIPDAVEDVFIEPEHEERS